MRQFVQGQLDCLCGLYSIVNALACFGESPEDVFAKCCKALPSDYWPRAAVEGVDLSAMYLMLAACYQVHSTWMFEPLPDWQEAIGASRFGSPSCLILNMLEPEDHWIVLRRNGNRFSLIDSAAKYDGLVYKRALATWPSIIHRENTYTFKDAEGFLVKRR